MKKSCLNCSKEFEEGKHEKKFCSNLCRARYISRAYYYANKKNPDFRIKKRMYARKRYAKLKDNPKFKEQRKKYFKNWYTKFKREKTELILKIDDLQQKNKLLKDRMVAQLQ
jgi:hypothetical protein